MLITFSTKWIATCPPPPHTHTHTYQVETVGSSLDLGYVYVLDTGKRIYVWCGTKSPLMARSKARLICEKINKFERKNKSEIIQIRAVSCMCVCVINEWCAQSIQVILIVSSQVT